MSWVDVVVVVLALIAAVSGWRHGMAVALLSFVGVLTGAVLGVRLAPLLAAGVEAPTTRIIVSIVVVVLLVALGETTGVFFGSRIRDRITGERTLQVDSTLGSVLQAITVVLAAWLVALPLASASFPGLAAGVRGSEVLRAVDSVMPEGAKALPAELRQLLNNSGFPDVLSPFAETPITEVGPPNPLLAQSPVVADVASSVLKVRGRAPSCARQLEGTGFVIGAAARADQRPRRRRHVRHRRGGGRAGAGGSASWTPRWCSTTPRSTSRCCACPTSMPRR